MTTHDDPTRVFDRRRFVTLAGAGAGLAAAVQLVGTGTVHAAPATPVNVGVMTPTGASYSIMGQSTFDGLTLGFDEARSGAAAINATIVRSDVDRGYGGAASTATALLDGGADVVVAGVSALVANRLGPLFVGRQASLVVANVGAHVVTPASKSANVVHNSLLYWHASYASGRWAAANLGRTAFIASCQCDSGYDTIYAFRRGFESAGGTIVGEAVTHIDPANDGLAALFGAVRSSGASVLYGLYSGSNATEFVQSYASSGAGAVLVAGSLAVEDCMLPAIGAPASGVANCAAWTAGRATRASQNFARAFTARFGRFPDPFAVLGYDTAVLVAEGVRRAVKNGLGQRRLCEALAGASIASPRGQLVVDPATNTVTGPLWMRRVQRTSSGLTNVDIAQVPPVASFPSALSPLGAGPVAGYLNEYLCA